MNYLGQDARSNERGKREREREREGEREREWGREKNRDESSDFRLSWTIRCFEARAGSETGGSLREKKREREARMGADEEERILITHYIHACNTRINE